MLDDHVLNITHLRDTLGVAYQHVAREGEPIVIRRYSREDVVLVPLWEWRFLKRLEAAVRAGLRMGDAAFEEFMEYEPD